MKERDLFSRTAEQKRRWTQLAEQGVSSEKRIPKQIGAIMFGVPQEILEKSGISVVPVDQDQLSVTFGPDCEKHYQNLGNWGEFDKKTKNRLLRQGYDFLFLVGQASVNPEVDFKQFIEDQKGKLLERVVPGIKQWREHVAQGGLIQNITPEDQGQLQGQLSVLFRSFDHSTQQELKSQGKHPENLFN